MASSTTRRLELIQRQVISCERCPRLSAYRKQVARQKRRAYRDEEYWGKPVPSFGDLRARLLLIGLAPGAHGANRTGRMFTGDSSGDFLYRALFETGFASQPVASGRNDGLRLIDAYITAPVRCAPPGNRPSTLEFENCRPYLEQELELLTNVRVVVTLGGLALRSYLTVLRAKGKIERLSMYRFAHGECHRPPGDGPAILCSYHPSRQNTQTGRLTKSMFLNIFRKAKRLLEG